VEEVEEKEEEKEEEVVVVGAVTSGWITVLTMVPFSN